MTDVARMPVRLRVVPDAARPRVSLAGGHVIVCYRRNVDLSPAQCRTHRWAELRAPGLCWRCPIGLELQRRDRVPTPGGAS